MFQVYKNDRPTYQQTGLVIHKKPLAYLTENLIK